MGQAPEEKLAWWCQISPTVAASTKARSTIGNTSRQIRFLSDKFEGTLKDPAFSVVSLDQILHFETF
jgi:hypothetical protein